jgi:hypothetical protein
MAVEQNEADKTKQTKRNVASSRRYAAIRTDSPCLYFTLAVILKSSMPVQREILQRESQPCCHDSMG